LICINGRKALQDEIQTLQAKDILRIDYYDKRNNPEHPEATEVLDFITIQRDFGGMISVQGTQHLNKAVGDYNVMAHYYTKNSEFLFGSLNSFMNYSNAYKNVYETFKLSDQTIIRTTTGAPATQKNDKWAEYANYSYHNQKTKIDLMLEYIQEEPISDTKAEYTYNIDSISHSILKNHTESVNHALFLNTHFSQQFNKDQLITLDLTASHSKNRYNRLYQETATEDDLTQTIESNVNEKYQVINGNILYQKTFPDKSKISANVINYQSQTKISYRNDMNADEELKTRESLAFLSYSKKWKKFSFYGKLGCSNTYFNQSDTISKSYFAFLPTLSIEYQLNNHSSLELSEYMYNNTPSLKWQSTVQQSIDFLQVNRGNPNVRQMNIWDNFLVYNLDLPKVSFVAYIRSLNNFNNAIMDVFRENDLFVHTYKTEGQYHLIKPAVSSKIEIVKDLLSAKMTGTWTRSWLTGSNAQTLAQWSFGGQLLFTQKNWMVTFGYNSPEKTLMNSGRTIQEDALYDFNASYTYHNLNISLGARNPFSKSYIRYKLSTTDYSGEEVRIQNRMGDHIIFTTISYHFQFGKKHDFQNKNINTNTNSAIMKGEI